MTKTTARATAQIVLYMDPDTKEIKAEIPGANGSRRKIEFQECELPVQFVDELNALNVWLRDQEQEKTRLEKEAEKQQVKAEKRFQDALHKRVWDTTASRKGHRSKEFADKTIGYRDKTQDIMDVL